MKKDFIQRDLSSGPYFWFNIGLKSDMIKTTRKTDSIFDWLGDCGGFMEALKIIGYIIVFPYNAYALKSTLVQDLVRFVPSRPRSFNKSAINKLEYR